MSFIILFRYVHVCLCSYVCVRVYIHLNASASS